MKRPLSHREQLYSGQERDRSTLVPTPHVLPTAAALDAASLPAPSVPNASTARVPTATAELHSDTIGTIVIVPNRRSVSRSEIANRAYENYFKSGGKGGQCEQYWLDAERELTSEAAAEGLRTATVAANEMTSEGGGVTQE